MHSECWTGLPYGRVCWIAALSCSAPPQPSGDLHQTRLGGKGGGGRHDTPGRATSQRRSTSGRATSQHHHEAGARGESTPLRHRAGRRASITMAIRGGLGINIARRAWHQHRASSRCRCSHSTGLAALIITVAPVAGLVALTSAPHERAAGGAVAAAEQWPVGRGRRAEVESRVTLKGGGGISPRSGGGGRARHARGPQEEDVPKGLALGTRWWRQAADRHGGVKGAHTTICRSARGGTGEGVREGGCPPRSVTHQITYRSLDGDPKLLALSSTVLSNHID